MSENEKKQNSDDNFLTEDEIKKKIEELDFWNRDIVDRKKRPQRLEVEPISTDAIKKGSCFRDEDHEPEKFSTNLAADGTDNSCEVVVLSADIRKSSITLVHAEDFPEYSRVLTDFICHIKDTWRSEPGRFFDKFTGDGALCFWVLPEEPKEDDAMKKDKDGKTLGEYYYLEWNRRIKETIDFSIEITCKFMEIFLPSFRKACGLIKKGFGLSIGVDAGNCFLTELQSSIAKEAPKDCYRIQYGDINIPDNEAEEKEEQRIIVSNNVTMMGRPVIGATRMVDAAKAYEIIVNCYPGAALKAKIDNPKEREIHKDLQFGLDLVFRGTKEYPYPDGVEAYRVNTDRIEHLKRKSGLVEEDEESSKESKKEPNSTICKQTKSE